MEIGKIHNFVDGLDMPSTGGKRRPFLRRTKYLGVPWVALIAAALVVSGALIMTLLVYNIEMQGAITLEGQEETSNILYDGARLIGATTTINTMDYPLISHGEHLTETHTIENDDGGTWDVTLDLSGMPLEYVDTQDEWYGFQFYVQKDGVNVTEFELAPDTTITLTYHYVLHDLFLATMNDFPFDLEISIEKQTAVTELTFPLDGQTYNGNQEVTITYTFPSNADSFTLERQYMDGSWQPMPPQVLTSGAPTGSFIYSLPNPPAGTVQNKVILKTYDGATLLGTDEVCFGVIHT